MRNAGWKALNLLICALFNEGFSSRHYVASHGRGVSE